MRILQILEAQLPKVPKVDDPDITQIRPRLQREGDLVWHLYKFFDMTEESSNQTNRKKNPEYRKALRQIVTGVIQDAIEKYGKTSPIWKKINLRKAVTDIVDDLYYSDPGQHPDTWFEPYNPDEFDDDVYNEADWHADYQAELNYYNRNLAIRGWNSTEASGQYIKNHWGRRQIPRYARTNNTGIPPKVEKQVKQIRVEVLKRVNANHDRLPQEHFFSKVTKLFKPKQNVRVYVPRQNKVYVPRLGADKDEFDDWTPIESIEAKLDEKGNVSQVKFRVHGGGAIEHKGIENWDPDRMRVFFKYYKEHADW